MFFQEFGAMPKLRHGRQAAFDRQSLGKAQASAGCFPSQFAALLEQGQKHC